MTEVSPEAVNALKVLRRGRGLAEVGLGRDPGPLLRDYCRVEESDLPAEVQRKLADWMRSASELWPRDVRDAFLVAYGLHEDAQQRFLTDRMEWAAVNLVGRDPRTLERWVVEAIRLLARSIEGGSGSENGVDGAVAAVWRTSELRVCLSLDLPVPEAFETRRIVAESAVVTELDLAISVPAGSDGVLRDDARGFELDVFYGGRLAGLAMESSDRYGLRLRLSKPLRAGESHEYGLRYRAEMAHPHYVCVPRYPCDSFELRVRFGANRPEYVRRLDGAFQNDSTDPTAIGSEVLLDACGELCVGFSDLKPGFAYGVKWARLG